MNYSSEILEKVNHAIASMEYPAKPEGLYEPMRYVLSMGGKRIRTTPISTRP